jgi:arabinogalactan oligomer / maltooligosaccharide transport system permease protein
MATPVVPSTPSAPGAGPVTTGGQPPKPPGPPVARGRRRMPAGRYWRHVGWRHVVGLATLAFAFYPVVWVLSAAFTPGAGLSGQQLIPENPSTENFRILLNGEQVPFVRWLANSLVISSITAAGAVFMSALAAYAFSRMRFRGRRPALLSLLLVQMFPQLLAIVAIFSLMVSLGAIFPAIGFGSQVGLVLVYLGGALGMNTWLMKGFFDTIPESLDHSARVDGAGHALIFFKIVLPLVRPILAVIGLLAFIASLNDFLVASVLLRDENRFTLAVGLTRFIQDQFGANWGVFAAGAVMGGLPVIVLFMYLQRYLVAGLTQGAVKG